MENDVKSEVKKLVDERLAVDAPEIYFAGNELKKLQSDECLTVFGQLATLDKEYSEIIAFLLDIKSKMNEFFCKRGI